MPNAETNGANLQPSGSLKGTNDVAEDPGGDGGMSRTSSI